MPIVYPRPLVPGDVVGVTAPSAGVFPKLGTFLDGRLDRIRAAGFEVREGAALRGKGLESAPRSTRLEDLRKMFADPSVRAIVPPWGGEKMIGLVPELDYAAYAEDPTWIVGYSDITNLTLPLTLLTGVATVSGQNLMDPYVEPDGIADWLDVVQLPEDASFTQRSPRAYRSGPWFDYVLDPSTTALTVDTEGGWVRLDDAAVPYASGGDAVDVTGRLIGGNLEITSVLAGTKFGDIPKFAEEHAGDDGLIVFVDHAEISTTQAYVALQAMRLAGWFDAARAVLYSRARSKVVGGFTLHQAIQESIGDLGIPVFAEVECGHVPPHLTLVNGALTRVTHDDHASTVEQTLVP
ncbi:MAG: LD-carboxypeptidase [Cellulomonadaceae bacterium]|jgi:muramoyltetrapeptide carboxypeptidase LdcA involved in peptidoglycan recycling|nr:LD-carboxypeptidase [Cellulomonadaceae bacterium]